jgi:glycosyltransferase involved in cell wall biosynthesis
MTPFLSVLIPTYNRVELTREAVASVGNNPDVEIIVVDDGSDAKTFTAITKWAKDFPTMRLYYNETNLGLTKNWNKCLEYATGEWISLIGSDDTYTEGAIDRAVKFIKTLPGPSLIVFSTSTWCEVWMPGAYTVRGLKLPSGSGNFWHRKIYEDMGGFDERLTMSPDCEYWYRIATKYPIVKVPDRYAKYREHEGNIMWSFWRDKPEMIKQMSLLLQINMVYRGEDVNDLDVVAATVEAGLWETIVYIMKKTSTMPDKHDIFDSYYVTAQAMASTKERRKHILDLASKRNETK